MSARRCRATATRATSSASASATRLRHAAPDFPRERYGELADRYRHHYLSSQDEIVLFDGTLEMLLALKARNHWLAVATGKTRRGLDQALAGSPLGAACSTPRAPPTRRAASPTR